VRVKQADGCGIAWRKGRTLEVSALDSGTAVLISYVNAYGEIHGEDHESRRITSSSVLYR
jgi:hypothetical protein